MRILKLVALLCSSVTLLGIAAGCTDLGVGRKCVNPQVDQNGMPAMVNGTAVVSPALECPERLCLLDSDTSRDVCTAGCTTNDDCANAVSGDPQNGQCNHGFVCAIPTVVGPYCCRKFCMCKDDLVQGQQLDDNGNLQVPPSCRPGSGSSCANL